MNGYSFDVTPTEVKDKALLLRGYLYGHKHLCPLSGQKGKLVQTTLDVYYEKGRTSTGWALWTKQTHIALRVHTGVTYQRESNTFTLK